MTENAQVALKPIRFMGHYEHTLDDRGRISLPAKFREKLDDRVVLTKGKGRFLIAYPWAEWELLLSRLDGLSVANDEDLWALQQICGNASEQEIDRQGRILIPADLRQYAGIKGEVIIKGLNTRFGIWAKEVWLATQAELDEKQAYIMQNLVARGIKL